jgi:transcriptional regulator with XRE-family HTH domain
MDQAVAELDEQVRRRTGNLGLRVKKLRTERSLTIRELAARAGIASSTISKVENGLMSPTYDNIVRIALGLDVDVERLFNEKATAMHAGRRSVTRAGEGIVIKAKDYRYEMLSTDIAHKKFVPIVATLSPSKVENAANFLRHEGEEFVYVLSGRVTILTDIYRPLHLEPGDSCYFDSSMGHILVAANDAPAVILWVASIVEPNLLQQLEKS